MPPAPSADAVAPSPVHAVPVKMSRTGTAVLLMKDYLELIKVRVTALVVMTAWAGFYLGCMRSGVSSIQPLLIAALVGIGLASGGSAALNEAIERRLDAKMIRTANRPMAAGRISLAHGVIVGLASIVLSTIILAFTTNLITVALTLLTVLIYVVIYTPLKRVTTSATFIGAFPGALPALIGWTAIRGHIEWAGVALFAIMFVWQFPHFMAISWLYREDYGRAGIRMLPVVQPDGWSTVLEALVYAILMIPVSLLPVYLHVAGDIYGAIAVILGIVYLAYTIRFTKTPSASKRSYTESKRYARELLKVSVIYLPLLLTALMLNAVGRR